jgi:predicted nucleotidyltransferase
MQQAAPSQLKDSAEQAAHVYAALPTVDGICLFGSVARGDAHAASDIDLLVLGTNPEFSPAVLLRMLSADQQRNKWSLLYFQLDDLRRLLATASPFALHLRREGQILYDRHGILAALLSDADSDTDVDTRKELEIRLSKLRVYGDLRIFRSNFLFPLSHLYSIGKSVVMLALAAEGTPEYNREAAFTTFASRHPERESDVNAIAALLPFYLLASRGIRKQLPFSYRGAEREVRTAVAAIERIAGVLNG